MTFIIEIVERAAPYQLLVVLDENGLDRHRPPAELALVHLAVRALANLLLLHNLAHVDVELLVRLGPAPRHLGRRSGNRNWDGEFENKEKN